MFRVTRKQLITDGTAAEASVLRFEDSRVVATRELAEHLARLIRASEMALGSEPYGPDKVIFETPTFYRSVTVTIEEVN